MIRISTTNIETYSIDWAEAYEAIRTYIHNKYSLSFAEQNFQIRVVSNTGVSIKPDLIRFKRSSQSEEETLCPKK